MVTTCFISGACFIHKWTRVRSAVWAYFFFSRTFCFVEAFGDIYDISFL
ncbi:unnamed protein product, partial [Ixodes pacificus]